MKNRRLFPILVCLVLFACSDARLQAVQPDGPPPVDDKLALSGSICTKVPTDEAFPVKILFVIDTSYSMQVTDPTQERVRAVQQVLDRYAGNPSVEVAIVAFDAVVSNVTAGFTNNPDLAAITGRLANADRLTDYQGALGTAYAILTQDMIESSPAERARSKYVVIFFSDGVPDPQCAANEPAQFQNVCTVDREEWPEIFDLPPGTNPNTGAAWTWDDFQGLYPDLDAGADYNTVAQLSRSVEDILELQEIYNANEVRFHTGFLFDPGVPPEFIEAFNLNRTAGIALLSGLARTGNGTFTEFASGDRINFLNINYTSVKQNYALKNFAVYSASALPNETTKLADSDGDGISDLDEDELGLCSYERGGARCNLGDGTFRDPLDSDGDGYGDLFELRLRDRGFDPARADPTLGNCAETDDSDGDRLLDCEETVLGTDPRLFDTDRDRLSDGLELRAGLDPANGKDAYEDADADGTLNGEEILRQWSPVLREVTTALPPAYQYTVTHVDETPEGRNCYDFEVENIELETTRAIRADQRGQNRIWLHFIEGAIDDPRDFGTPRVACVEARYVAPDFKSPANGRLVLGEEDFFDPADPELRCVSPRARVAP